MRRNLPRYVERTKAKGKDYYYFRRSRDGPRFRMPGLPGDAAFEVEYVRRLGTPNPERKSISSGSLAALIKDYKQSDEYLSLKPKTQADYARMLDRFSTIDGFPAEAIKRRHIRELRKNLAGKGRSQQLFSQVASLLFNFGVDNDYCDVNPAARMKRHDRAKAFKAWTDEDCNAFEQSGPAQHLLTAYMLARYTGQRRGDVLKMTRNAYSAGSIKVRPTKTERHADDNEQLWIPAHSRLREYLDALPKTALLFVVDAKAQPLLEGTFTKEFRWALDAAGLQGLNFHGLRHTAGRALAEAGCSEKEIMAVLGHRTSAMVQKYTKAARQRRLASRAIAKLEGTRTERETPKPSGEIPKL